MTEAAKKSEEVRAKLFTNGRSQAVRLPKEFRFEGKEVRTFNRSSQRSRRLIRFGLLRSVPIFLFSCDNRFIDPR